jgi:MoaA/NifB/PqqE/SkfB family radical SAM enzyme
MTADQVRSVISQAAELGVSVIVFAGGEPLIRKDEILALAASYPSLLFAVFTNGLLIDEDLAVKIAATRNIVPVISFEGHRAETDLRRGSGVFGRLVATCSLLKERGVFFGCSITATRSNFDSVLDREFIRSMVNRGARAFIYVEYVPIEPGTEDLVLADGQRSVLGARLSEFMKQFPALFIGFPGDEEAFGGCLAAGRGFVHVSPAGDLEPCPAAPFSDTNLTKVPLKEAFRSGFLEKIRSEHNLLTESEGGCALWTNRGWAQGLLLKQ